jgi:hypothetical protein
MSPTPISIISMSDLYENEPFREIVALGVTAIPHIVEKQKEDHSLGQALQQITKWKCHIVREGKSPNEWVWTVEEFPNMRLQSGPPDARVLWLRWWNEGRKQTGLWHQSIWQEWRDLKKQGKEQAAKDKYQRLIDLGIAALPVIMEKVAAGDRELVPLVSQLTTAKVDPNASIEQCVSWWEQNKEQWLIPFPNKRPTASAGKDQQVVSGATVLLDGSGSTDEDKDKLTYQWKQTAGPTVEMSDARVVQPSFAAPNVNKETALVFELVVNDGSPKKEVHPACQSGQSEPDTVTITVRTGN